MKVKGIELNQVQIMQNESQKMVHQSHIQTLFST